MKDSASLVSFPSDQGHVFSPTGIKLTVLSEASNDHFEFFDAFTQGYEEVSQKFTSIRRVRGDNYCALRATLFQAMSQQAVPPPWLQDPELMLVRCCRFESAAFPGVSVRKTPLCRQCCVLAASAVWRQYVCLSSVRLGLFFIDSTATKSNGYFPEEKNNTIYLNNLAELAVSIVCKKSLAATWLQCWCLP